MSLPSIIVFIIAYPNGPKRERPPSRRQFSFNGATLKRDFFVCPKGQNNVAAKARPKEFRKIVAKNFAKNLAKKLEKRL
jgi:hypothetical protein